MDRLPTELQELIVAHCDTTSLKHLRLTNRALQDAATPLLFGHIYLGYFPHHLEHLCQLSKSPVANNVKEVTVFSDLLPKLSEHEWLNKIDFRPPYKAWSEARKNERRQTCEYCANKSKACRKCQDSFFSHGSLYAKLPRHNLPQPQLVAAWSRYEELRRSQLAWREYSEGAAFQESIAMLPNIVSAELICATPFQGRANKLPVWARIYAETFVGPDEWMYSRNEQTSRHDGQAALTLLESIGYRSSFAGTKPITTLNVQSTYRLAYYDLMGATISQGGCGLTIPLHALRYQNLRETFNHLTELRLDVPHAGTQDENARKVAAETCLLLRSAPNLRRLDLGFSDEEQTQTFGESDIDGLFRFFDSEADGNPAPYWPHLEHFGLLTNVAYSGLLQFLQRHSSTLRSLELRDMIIPDAHAFLTKIPVFLELKHVYVECIWSWCAPDDPQAEPRWPYSCYLAQGTDHNRQYERHVKAYLLGKRKQLPAFEAEGQCGEAVVAPVANVAASAALGGQAGATSDGGFLWDHNDAASVERVREVEAATAQLITRMTLWSTEHMELMYTDWDRYSAMHDQVAADVRNELGLPAPAGARNSYQLL